MGYAFRESVLTFSFLFIDAFLYAHQFVVSFAGKLLYRTKKEHVKNFIQSHKNEEKTLDDYRVKLLKANFIHMNNCVYEYAGVGGGYQTPEGARKVPYLYFTPCFSSSYAHNRCYTINHRAFSMLS